MLDFPLAEIARTLNTPLSLLEKEKEIIKECWEKLLSVATFQFVSAFENIQVSERKIQLSSFSIPSEKLSKHFQSADQLYIYASTLGISVDKLLKREGFRNMEHTLLLNACANVYIEQKTEEHFILQKKALSSANRFMSIRFSPGYLDLPLTLQKPLLERLDTSKKIGLSHTENFFLIPEKSITAFAAISDYPLIATYQCDACNFYEKCKNEGGFLCDISTIY